METIHEAASDDDHEHRKQGHLMKANSKGLFRNKLKKRLFVLNFEDGEFSYFTKTGPPKQKFDIRNMEMSHNAGETMFQIEIRGVSQKETCIYRLHLQKKPKIGLPHYDKQKLRFLSVIQDREENNYAALRAIARNPMMRTAELISAVLSIEHATPNSIKAAAMGMPLMERPASSLGEIFSSFPSHPAGNIDIQVSQRTAQRQAKIRDMFNQLQTNEGVDVVPFASDQKEDDIKSILSSLWIESAPTPNEAATPETKLKEEPKLATVNRVDIGADAPSNLDPAHAPFRTPRPPQAKKVNFERTQQDDTDSPDRKQRNSESSFTHTAVPSSSASPTTTTAIVDRSPRTRRVVQKSESHEKYSVYSQQQQDAIEVTPMYIHKVIGATPAVRIWG